MTKKSSLDHLMEQNETDLPFLSAYGGGEEPKVILQSIKEISAEHFELELCDDGVRVKFVADNLPLVNSDINSRGFSNGTLSDNRSKLSVIINEWGPEQRRLIERLVEFIADE